MRGGRVGHNWGMAPQLRTAIPVWVASLIAAVLIGVLAPADEYLRSLPLAMLGAVLMVFVIQIATAQEKGLVDRIMVSFAGVVVILGGATLVLGLIAAT